jgi:predicted  nucleic acid-binding Zn-ribbon protein
MTRSAHFKLYDAALCCECDEVFERGPSACPSCTCTHFLYLSSFVPPKLGRAEINKRREEVARSEHGSGHWSQQVLKAAS